MPGLSINQTKLSTAGLTIRKVSLNFTLSDGHARYRQWPSSTTSRKRVYLRPPFSQMSIDLNETWKSFVLASHRVQFDPDRCTGGSKQNENDFAVFRNK